MNMKFLKRVLAATLAATLMVAPALTAGATGEAVTPTSDVKTASSAGGATTTVAGAYLLKETAGVACRSDAGTIKASAGLAANESAFARVYDITRAKSGAAYASADAAATALGGVVLTGTNIDFCKMTAGKFSRLDRSVAVPCTIGVKNANGRRLVVVAVYPGGEVQIFEDQDSNPNTITVNVTGGLAAYFVVAI